MDILTLLERIPPQFVAIVVSVLASWLFLRLQPDKGLRQALSPVLMDFAVTYTLVTRFAGLFLHPGVLLHLNGWALLAQAPASGFVFGLAAGTVVVCLRLRKTHHLDTATLYGLTVTGFASLSTWLCVRLFVDRAVYLERDIILLLASGVLLWLALVNRHLWHRYVHRLWITIGAILLLDSTLVPSISTFMGLTSIEWTGFVLLLGGLALEAVYDVRTHREISEKTKSPPAQ